jgi:hypothetical protein
MKKLLLSLLVAVFPVFAVAEEMSAVVKREAQACTKALLASDYDGIVRYTHPRIIAGMGGKEEMIALIKRGVAEMKTEGLAIEKATVTGAGEPKPVGDWLISLVSQELVMRVPKGRLQQDAVLLGISENLGKSWVFVDLGPQTKSTFATLFPELDGKFPFPERKEPVFKADSKK